ncbi:MAG: NAD-dependent epimerase/dehydratase family protein [Euryarchaeota archaeon]|nr:NAD-dependent epimerase/dehydratase family protein [Euryarchaeota archaeon]
MKVLVTGGAGFIGSATVDLLLEEGYSVVIIDDLSTGRASNINPRATFYKMDITHKGLEKVLRKERAEGVVHAAAQPQVRRSLGDPILDARANILGTINLLLGCGKVEKFVYASSGGAVYGEPRYLPVDEEHPVAPLSPYGLSKYVAESYLEVLRDLPYTVLRYGNVYGPRQDPDGEAGVVAIFAGRLLRGQRPTIFGDGKQTRDFVFVGDVARANLLALEKGEGVLNIGSGRETSVLEVLDALKALTGRETEPVYAPPVEGEVRRIYLSIEKARRVLGWRPTVRFSDGAARLLEHLTSRSSP